MVVSTVSQLEQFVRNQQVEGSIPPAGSSISPYKLNNPFNWILPASANFILKVDNVMDNGISGLTADRQRPGLGINNNGNKGRPRVTPETQTTLSAGLGFLQGFNGGGR